MLNTKKSIALIKSVLCIAMIMAVLFSCLAIPVKVVAHAAEADMDSFVMYELTSDPSFRREDYPDVATDYSLQLIHIGESSSRDLYLYVYQPSHNSIDLLGTSVSISYGYSKDGMDLNPRIYDLELVSSSGVFDKYLVVNFAKANNTEKDSDRYYNIVTIYRKFNSIIDKNIGLGDTEGKGYSVGQQWSARTVNGSVEYRKSTFETLDVTIKIVDNIHFNGRKLFLNLTGRYDECDAWFVGFDIEDYIAEHIYNADITFKVRSRDYRSGIVIGNPETLGEWSDYITITLTDEDTMAYKGSGLLGKKFEWNRILSSSDYIAALEAEGLNISEATRERLNSSQWVFSFYETETRTENYNGGLYTHASQVGEFAILRLYFLDVNHKYYNLGVVSDKVTPDNVAGITGTSVKDIKEALEELLAEIRDGLGTAVGIIGIILLVVILIAVCVIVEPIGKAVMFILKAIAWVICAPFKFIAWIFGGSKRRKRGKL